MAEINNALAAQIKVPDSGNPLDTLGKLNQFQLGQQALQHRQFLYDQGGGYDPGELSTLADTKAKEFDLQSRVGNLLANAKGQADVRQAIDMTRIYGIKVDPRIEQHLLNAPIDQIHQYGANMQQAGQSSQAAVEQTGVPAGNRTREEGRYIPQGIPPNEPIISRTEAATGGRRAPVPSSPAIVGDDEAVRRGLYSPTPEQIKRGVTGPQNPVAGPKVIRNPDGSISSSVTPETTATQTSLAKDYEGYRDSAKNAAMTKYVLKNMSDDADRLSTGKGATFTNNVRQWIQSAQSIPGVGDAVKKIVGDQSDPIAAFEALQKNAGQLTRATLRDVDGKAAAEYRMIQSQLPNVEMSPRGLKLVTAQMIAPEDYKQAKLQAADNWKRKNNGSLGGFEADWNKSISPSTFLFARLPDQERNVLIKNMSKTAVGREQLDNIKRQAKWAHDNGLDEFID